MLSSAEIVHKEIARKKATYEAEMAELVREEEAAVKEDEAARLAAEKAAKKTEKKGKKHAVEESRADVGAEGSKPKKRAKRVVVGNEDKNLLETVEVSCNVVIPTDPGGIMFVSIIFRWSQSYKTGSFLICTVAKPQPVSHTQAIIHYLYLLPHVIYKVSQLTTPF